MSWVLGTTLHQSPSKQVEIDAVFHEKAAVQMEHGDVVTVHAPEFAIFRQPNIDLPPLEKFP